VFYTFIAQLKRSIDAATPTPTHQFIKTLDTKKKLLRSYTQNIDGLETQVGLLGTASQEAKSSSKGKSKLRTKDVRNVQLHGDIHRVRCTACSAEYACSEKHLSFFEKGTAPDCPECLSRCMYNKICPSCFLIIPVSGGSYRSVCPRNSRRLSATCHCSL
jgi:NAD+-dependent protein deacetylase SIR2